MTCGWNRRRASELRLAFRQKSRVTTAALCGFLLWLGAVSAAAFPVPVLPFLPQLTVPPTPATTAAPSAPAASAVGARRAVTLFAGPGAALGPREQAWLQEDRAWLNGPGALFLPALTDADTALAARVAAEPADVAATSALRRRLATAAIARGDTISPLRGREAVLRDRWLARGYLQASVRSVGDTVLLYAGQPWTLAPWQVGGDDFPGRERLLDDLLPKAGSRFEAGNIDYGVRALLEAIGELGYPFPRWVVSDLRLDAAARTVTIVATLLPGTPARIGPVTSDVGDPRAERFLARASGLQPGAPLRGSDLHRAVERLWARDLYAELDTARVYTTTAVDTVGVHFPARLRPRQNRLQVVLGLSRRADTEKARLSGEVDLRLPNLASSGRALHVGWRDDGAGRSRFGFSWLEPLAFGTPLDVTLALDSEVQSEAYTRFTTELGARLSVVALWGLEVAAGRDRSTYPEGLVARTERTRARAAVLHRRGDRARSGWEGSFAVESAWRSSQAREGTAGTAELAAAVRQRLLSGDLAGEAWLWRRAALAARVSVRKLDGGEREAPLSEHFRFGGAASLRGYGEGEFHGVEAAWASLEWRLGPPRGSRLYTFWDVGYFGFWSAAAGEDAGGERRRGWPQGYGLGLLARTPGGDLSLAVGFPGTVDFDLAKLHVTLLESF
ncbi:MAG: BamA/TamA family outer membrane protein [bacterium]|nr:BamA/TamA family outer membrane protein [bacterium]